MDYRNCLISDIKNCAEVLKEAYFEPPYNETWASSDAEKYLSRFFQFDPALCFVAVNGSQILGGLFAYSYPWHKGTSCYIQELFVSPPEQRKGIGKELINHLSRAKGIGPTWLVANERSKASDFYKSLGLSNLGPYKFYAGTV